MSPIIQGLEKEVEKYTNYLSEVKKRNKKFLEFSLEVEGYMSAMTGFLFGHRGIANDL